MRWGAGRPQSTHVLLHPGGFLRPLLERKVAGMGSRRAVNVPIGQEEAGNLGRMGRAGCRGGPKDPNQPLPCGEGCWVLCHPLGGWGGHRVNGGRAQRCLSKTVELALPSHHQIPYKKKKQGKGRKRGLNTCLVSPPAPPREECGVLALGADAELLPGSCTLACVGRRQIAYPNEMNGLINHPPGSAEKHWGG